MYTKDNFGEESLICKYCVIACYDCKNHRRVGEGLQTRRPSERPRYETGLAALLLTYVQYAHSELFPLLSYFSEGNANEHMAAKSLLRNRQVFYAPSGCAGRRCGERTRLAWPMSRSGAV